MPRRTYGSGTLETLPSGNVRARIRVNGQRVKAIFGDAPAARAWLLEQAGKRATGATGARLDATLASLEDEFVADAKRHGLRGSTVDRLESHLAVVLKRWGQTQLRQINGPTLERIARDMAEAGWAAATIRNRLAVVTGLARYAMRQGYLDARPLHVRRPKLRLSDRPDPYTDAEVAAIRAAAELAGTREAAAVALMALCGLRRSEVPRVRACDVDATDRTLTVAILGEDERPKSGHSRTLPIPAEALAALDAVGVEGEAPIVGGDKAALDRLLSPVWAAAGVDGVRLHRLRHWWATTLIRRGLRLDQLMAWGGWTSLAAVRRYLHGPESVDRGPVDRLNWPTDVPRGVEKGGGGAGI